MRLLVHRRQAQCVSKLYITLSECSGVDFDSKTICLPVASSYPSLLAVLVATCSSCPLSSMSGRRRVRGLMDWQVLHGCACVSLLSDCFGRRVPVRRAPQRDELVDERVP